MFRLCIHAAPLPPREWTLDSSSERRHLGAEEADCAVRSARHPDGRATGDGAPAHPGRLSAARRGDPARPPFAALHREAGHAILGSEARIPQDRPGGVVLRTKRMQQEAGK
jgi:hypothetical protein